MRMSMPQNEPQFTSDKDLNESLPEAYSSKPPMPVIGQQKKPISKSVSGKTMQN
jgi:hypothetical protein